MLFEITIIIIDVKNKLKFEIHLKLKDIQTQIKRNFFPQNSNIRKFHLMKRRKVHKHKNFCFYSISKDNLSIVPQFRLTLQ